MTAISPARSTTRPTTAAAEAPRSRSSESRGGTFSGRHGDQEAAGGLGVEGELEEGGIDAGLDPQAIAHELAVALAGAGEVARDRQRHGPVDDGQG